LGLGNYLLLLGKEEITKDNFSPCFLAQLEGKKETRKDIKKNPTETLRISATVSTREGEKKPSPPL